MRLGASTRLLAYGTIILSALVVSSRCEVGGSSFLISVALASLAYLFAIRELSHTSQFSRRVVFVCLALSVLWRIAFLMTPPGPDDDIHRYVWDGRIQRLGYNPYLAIPSDPALAALHTADTRGLNHPELPTPYPAGAQLFFRAVTAIHESVSAFKVAFVICDFMIVFLLIHLLQIKGLAEHWVLAFAWHPLLAINVAGSGHIDILGVLLLLASALALVRRWRTMAAIAFALAVAVKFLPIALLPLFWRRIRLRDCAVAIFVFALLYLPFLEHGKIPAGSLATYLRSFRFNDPVFATMEGLANPQFAAGLALLIGLVTAIWLRSKSPVAGEDKWAWPMAASLICAPVIYPWYLLWLLPFLRFPSSMPLMVWTLSILPTFVVWHLRAIGKIWQLPGWVLLLEYGSLTLAAMISLRRKASYSPGPESAGDNR